VLMMTTSTPINNPNYLNQNSESLSSETFNDLDLMFYENIKPQLNQLSRNPEEETIAKILAYSRSL